MASRRLSELAAVKPPDVLQVGYLLKLGQIFAHRVFISANSRFPLLVFYVLRN